MVPNLPYFMVMFDYKGEKGYGHVIESGTSSQRSKTKTAGPQDETEGDGMEAFDGEKGEFPR